MDETTQEGVDVDDELLDESVHGKNFLFVCGIPAGRAKHPRSLNHGKLSTSGCYNAERNLIVTPWAPHQLMTLVSLTHLEQHLHHPPGALNAAGFSAPVALSPAFSAVAVPTEP